MYIENIQRIDSLRTELHSLILPRENELRLRWELKREQIYYSLSLYDLSFSKKNIQHALKAPTLPVGEKDQLIYRWNEALSQIYHTYFFRQEPLNEDALCDIYKMIQPKARYLATPELTEHIRYIASEDHPVTRAALIQSMIYNLKPLPLLNEPFSHLAFQTALTWAGWDLRGLVSIEEQYFHDRAYYKEIIQNTYTSGNVTQWIEYVSEVFIKQLVQVIETVSTKQYSQGAKKELFILNDRQKKALMILDEPESSISNRALQKVTGVSQMTAARDLSKLVELCLIVPHGKGRGITYTRT